MQRASDRQTHKDRSTFDNNRDMSEAGDVRGKCLDVIGNEGGVYCPIFEILGPMQLAHVKCGCLCMKSALTRPCSVRLEFAVKLDSCKSRAVVIFLSFLTVIYTAPIIIFKLIHSTLRQTAYTR